VGSASVAEDGKHACVRGKKKKGKGKGKGKEKSKPKPNPVEVEEGASYGGGGSRRSNSGGQSSGGGSSSGRSPILEVWDSLVPRGGWVGSSYKTVVQSVSEAAMVHLSDDSVSLDVVIRACSDSAEKCGETGAQKKDALRKLLYCGLKLHEYGVAEYMEDASGADLDPFLGRKDKKFFEMMGKLHKDGFSKSYFMENGKGGVADVEMGREFLTYCRRNNAVHLWLIVNHTWMTSVASWLI
jgi:hypothetical protein